MSSFRPSKTAAWNSSGWESLDLGAPPPGILPVRIICRLGLFTFEKRIWMEKLTGKHKVKVQKTNINYKIPKAKKSEYSASYWLILGSKLFVPQYRKKIQTCTDTRAVGYSIHLLHCNIPPNEGVEVGSILTKTCRVWNKSNPPSPFPFRI